MTLVVLLCYEYITSKLKYVGTGYPLSTTSISSRYRFIQYTQISSVSSHCLVYTRYFHAAQSTQGSEHFSTSCICANRASEFQAILLARCGEVRTDGL